MGDHPSPVNPLPDITFEKEYTVKLGGRELELKYFGPSHELLTGHPYELLIDSSPM